MDAPSRLTDLEADRKLRDLFAQAGPLLAPDDLEARVLHRLAAAPVSRLADDRPLIAGWIWTSLGLLLMVLVLFSLLSPDAARETGSEYQRYLPELAIPDLGRLVRSPWTLMALACAAAFLCLEAILFRPQAVRSER
jgi:hypothetical protein